MSRKLVERKHTAKAEVRVHDLSKRGTSIKVELSADKKKAGHIDHWAWLIYMERKGGGRRGITFSWSEFAGIMEQSRT